ncbi:MAG: MFS transporter, partial [Clostridiales bacterium]|nr:MFS transporter [Clostridiales bacterium]
VLICLTPPYFSRYGKISFMSGLLNSCTYVGSALSTYGIAVLLQNRGWNATMIAWYAIAMVGLALCVLFARAWARFKRQQDEM